ncbi:MAG: tetratricopeptide repeat protein [Bacteroidota bacterium]
MAEQPTILTSREIHVKSLLDEAYEGRTYDLPTSIKLTQEAILASQEFEDQKLYTRALNQLALFHMITGDYEESISLSEKALTISEKANDLKGIADAKYNIASVHYKSDNFHLGLEFLLECLATYKLLGDYHNQARS